MVDITGKGRAEPGIFGRTIQERIDRLVSTRDAIRRGDRAVFSRSRWYGQRRPCRTTGQRTAAGRCFRDEILIASRPPAAGVDASRDGASPARNLFHTETRARRIWPPLPGFHRGRSQSPTRRPRAEAATAPAQTHFRRLFPLP